MEAIVMAVTWDRSPESAAPLFQRFRPEAGEEMVLEQNTFVEKLLHGAALRDLTEAEMAAYRRLFARPAEGLRSGRGFRLPAVLLARSELVRPQEFP
jgi:haloalkane dehalogenase